MMQQSRCMLVLFVLTNFCQSNVAIAFYIGGILTTLTIFLLVVSYTYIFEVSVPAEKSITA
jgi:hypothetical protein